MVIKPPIGIHSIRIYVKSTKTIIGPYLYLHADFRAYISIQLPLVYVVLIPYIE